MFTIYLGEQRKRIQEHVNWIELNAHTHTHTYIYAKYSFMANKNIYDKLSQFIHHWQV